VRCPLTLARVIVTLSELTPDPASPHPARSPNYPASHAGTLFLPNGDIFQGEYAFDLKDGPGTFFYVSKNKRYDGVWSKDVGKCGLYGTIEQQDDDSSSGLPRLTLLEPMGVLENQAYSLQEKREMEHSMALGDSGFGNTSGYGEETWQEGDVTGDSQQEYIEEGEEEEV
jgi:hypothetical protein